MSHLSFSPRAFRQFITLFLIYSLVLNLPVIAAARRIAGNDATTISASNSVAPVTPAAPVMAMAAGDITQIGSPGTSVGLDQTTTSYTLAAGNNRALIVTVTDALSTDITGVSFNGQTLTRVAQAADNSDGVVNSVWVRAMGSATSSTTGNITITRNGSSCETGILAVAYENVDQTTPMNGAQSLVQPFTGNTYTSSSLTISSKPGDLVFDAVYGFNTIPLTAGSGQTVVHSSSTSGLTACSDSQLRTSVKSGAASVGMSWSTTAQLSLHVGANINKAVLVPMITSATYDASSGVLAVTAADMTTGDTIDVSKLTLKGEGGSTYTLTTSNVTATSSTAFSVTLNASDKLNINGILNRTGTSSFGFTTYNLAAATNWDTTASAAADLTGNGITVSNVLSPIIASATYDSSTGVLNVRGNDLVKNIGAANDIDVSKLTITGEGGATYTLTTTSIEITSDYYFDITLNGADRTAISQIFNKNGTSSTSTTTYNLAAASGWNGVAARTDLTGNGITVSNVAVPTITSATYDSSTGVLAVTGTGLLKLNGATNDINVSKLTITGEGGSTYTLTTTSVEITSGTSFSVTLNASDKATVNQIVNKNGTSSTGGTTYNLAAAEDWAAGADAAVVVAELTGNGITVSNVAVPTITSATYDSTTGFLAVTGTGLLKLSGLNNDIDVSKLSISGDATAYPLTSSSVEITSGTSFSVTLNATDKTALQTRLNKNGTSSVGAVTYNLRAAEDWAAGTDAAVVVADLTGNGITVSNAAAAPTLGNYSTATVIDGNSTTSTPSAAPTGTTSATAYTSSDFKGLFSVDPTTGVVRVTNAQPAGTYTVTVAAFGAGGTATKTFTLTVNNPSACNSVGFASATDVSVSSGMYAAALGDFNGDGKLDLLAANNLSSNNNVSLRLGDGAGAFTGTTNITVGFNPLALAVGDFNGDGKLDFAAANSSTSGIFGSLLFSDVSIRLGDGAGGFTNAGEVSVEVNPYSLTVGDFNGDGKLDFAAANQGSNTISIRLGNGAGGFTNGTNVGTGAGPQSVVAGDFNADSKLDLAIANVNSNTVSIRLGNGTGGFTGTTNITVGANPLALAIGDFNSDSKLDFAVANYSSSTVSIRLGDGAGGFTNSTDVSVSSGPYSVTTGNLNGDGKLDLITASLTTANASIRLGDGAGSFTGTTNISVGSQPRSVITGDLNGDGKLDFGTGNYGAATVSIRLNSCTNNAAPTITASSALARTAGGTAGNATVATVNDTETAAGSLTVAATTIPTGITVSNIVNTNGTITADVAVGCTATIGANTVVFTVTDGGALTATANLTVNVTSTAVSVGTPPASQTVNIGSSVTFSVTATNAVSYQWRKGGQPINTATGSSYTINPATLSEAGSYDVVVTGLCGNATSTAATLAVNKLSSTTTVASSINPSTFGQSVNLSATVTGSSATGAITFKDGATTLGTASLASGAASLTTSSLAVGSHSITAEYGGDGTHLSSTSTALSQIVNPASLTITWNTPANVTYGTALSVTQLNAIAGVAGSFSYSPAIGTVLGAGTYTLNTTFTPTDTTNYQSANSSVTIVVAKAPLTVTAEAKSRDYGVANPTFTYLVSGFVNGDTVSVVSGTPNLTTLATPANGVGGYAISAAAGTLSASNYQFSFVPATLTVNKATLTVTADAKARNYGTANPTLTATYSGFVNGDTTSVLSGAPALSTTATAASNIGDYPITAAAGTLAANNYLFNFAPGTLTVNQATLTVTADAKSRNYGEANPTLTYQVTGFSNGDTPSILTGSPSLTTTATNASGVGSYPITTAVGTLAAANYQLAFVNSILTINQATLTVTAEGKVRNYGAANPTLTYQVAGFANSDTVNVLSGTPNLTTTATTASNVGDYPISAAAGTLSASNYQFSFVPSTLTVNKATLTVTADAKARNYGVTNPMLTASYSGFVNGDTAAVLNGAPAFSTTAIPTSNIGDYPISTTAGTLTANNYLFSFATGILTVNKAPLTVAADDKSRSYGVDNPVLTGQISGIQNNDQLTANYATTATSGSAVGTYPITPTLNDPNSKGGNYDVQLTSGVLTIGKVTLTFTAEDVNRTYGSENPVLTYKISGFSNSENASVLSGTPQLSTTATSSSNVGNYPINIGAGSLVAANYDLAFVPAKLTVTHASLTVTAESQTRPYGTANPQLSVSFSGFVNGDSMNLTSGGAEVYTTALPNSPAGTYPIYVNGVTNPNYSINYVKGVLTVTSVKPTFNLATNLAPSELGQIVSITASARPSTQFGGAPSGTVIFTVDGKQLSPSILNATGQATYSSSDLTIGSHTITASYNGDNNYQAGTKDLVQEVSKASSITTLTSSANPASTGQRIILTAKVKGSASQPTGSVEFFDGTKSLGSATLKDGVATLALTELPEGSHALTAVYAGDNVSDRSVSSVLTQQVTSECVYALSQQEIVIDATGGSFAITLITRSSCPWSIDNQNSWIEVRSPDIVNGQWVTTFVVSPLTEAKIRVGKFKFANQEVIVTQSRPTTTVQAASYDRQSLAPSTIASIFGTDLSAETVAASSQPLPSDLGGVRVKVRDSKGKEQWVQLLYVSPNQINFLVPSDVAEGELIVTVVRGTIESSAGKFILETVAPGLFSADATGSGSAAAQVQRVTADGTQTFEATASFNRATSKYEYQPIIMNTGTSLVSDDVYLVLYGTGMRHRSSLQNVRVRIGGQEGEVLYVGDQFAYPGLDQVNIRLPQSLAGAGLVDIILSVDGKTANTVKIFIQ